MSKRHRKSDSGRRVKHVTEYLLLRAVLLLLVVLPLPAALWIARRLGDFAFDVVRIRREVTLDNLRRAFAGEKSEGEIRALARGAYRTMGMTFIELTLFGFQDLLHLLGRMRFVGEEHLRAAAAMDRGIICITGHVGNWESCAASTAAIDEPMTVGIAEQRNPYVNRFVIRSRERMQMRLVPVGYALKEMIRTLRRGGRIGLAADQDAGRDGVAIPFMGRLASTAVGPARIAYRTGSPILIGLDRHLGRGRHEIRYYPPILADRGRPEEEETRRIMGEYARRLEAFVRSHPEQYFWMHRRWKTRLPETQEGADAMAELRLPGR